MRSISHGIFAFIYIEWQNPKCQSTNLLSGYTVCVCVAHILLLSIPFILEVL